MSCVCVCLLSCEGGGGTQKHGTLKTTSLYIYVYCVDIDRYIIIIVSPSMNLLCAAGDRGWERAGNGRELVIAEFCIAINAITIL